MLDFTLWWLWAGCYVILALNKKGYNECTFLGHIYFVFPFSQAKLPVSNAAICCKIEWDNRNYPWLIETSPHSMFTLCCFAPPATAAVSLAMKKTFSNPSLRFHALWFLHFEPQNWNGTWKIVFMMFFPKLPFLHTINAVIENAWVRWRIQVNCQCQSYLI